MTRFSRTVEVELSLDQDETQWNRFVQHCGGCYSLNTVEHKNSMRSRAQELAGGRSGNQSSRAVLSLCLRCIAWVFAALYSLLIFCGVSQAADTNDLLLLQQRCHKLIADQYRLAEAKPVVDQLLALTLNLRGEVHPDTVIAL